jgi:simple sugar transport system permease protein
MTPPVNGRALVAGVLPVAIALLGALACASALILAAGHSPIQVYRLLLDGTWGNAYGIGQVLFKATPLILTGLAVSLPFQAGLFNVGAEGQLVVGAFAAGLCGAALPARAPAIVALPACLACAFAGGAAIGVVPGLLKALRGAHEVIVTIMLNFVVIALLADVGKRFYLRETVHTDYIAAGARLPAASLLFPSLRGSAVSAALLLALVVACVCWWFLRYSAAGFRLRAVGLGAPAAAAAGISVRAQTILAFALGGGLAGLAGGVFVLGYKHYYEEGFSGGTGFMGIAVALLGRNHPSGIAVAALLFGTLSQGGLAINASVPKELVDVLQAVIILAVAAAAAATPVLARRAAGRDPTVPKAAAPDAGADPASDGARL